MACTSEERQAALDKAHGLLDMIRAAGYTLSELFRDYYALYPAHGVSETAL